MKNFTCSCVPEDAKKVTVIYNPLKSPTVLTHTEVGGIKGFTCHNKGSQETDPEFFRYEDGGYTGLFDVALHMAKDNSDWQVKVS